MTERGKQGFASLTLKERQIMASRGGRAYHRVRKGFHTMTPEERLRVARKGGIESGRGRKKVKQEDQDL